MASKFTFITGNTKQKLEAYKSPRSLKCEGERPAKIVIDAHEEFNLVEFLKYINYLIMLSNAMKLTPSSKP